MLHKASRLGLSRLDSLRAAQVPLAPDRVLVLILAVGLMLLLLAGLVYCLVLVGLLVVCLLVCSTVQESSREYIAQHNAHILIVCNVSRSPPLKLLSLQ